MKNILTITIFLFLIITGCKSENSKPLLMEVSPEYAAYISAYTSGLVSTETSIKVLLQSDYPFEVNEDKSIKEDIIKFYPSISGKAYLTDRSTIEFIPDKKLKQGEIYTGKLDLSKIMKNVPDSMKLFKFQFQAKKQDFSVSIDGVQDSEKGQGNYQLQGNIYTADVSNSGNFDKFLTAEFDGKNLPVKWEHSENRKNHRFIIEGIEAQENEKSLKLKWNGKSIEADKNEVTEFKIPAKNSFKITQIKAVSYPEQYVSINFSEALQNDLYLEGLVDILKTNKSESDEDYYYEDLPQSYIKSMVINGNELKIYTSKRIGGEYEVKLFPGIVSAYGNRTQKEFKKIIDFISLYPEVKFVGNGNIIPTADGKINLPFQAVGLKAVRVEITKIFEKNIHQFFQYNHYDSHYDLKPVGRKVFSRVISIEDSENFNVNEMNVYQLELSKFIKPEPGAIYNVQFSIDRKFATYPCQGNSDSDEFLTPVNFKKDDYDTDTEMYGYDDSYYYPEDYRWSDRNNPCTSSYYTSDKNVSKNILATNLGISFKTGKDRMAYVTVTDIINAKPLENVRLTAYDLQNQIVGEGSTDRQGFANFKLNRKPFLVIAEKEGQKGYIKVDNGSSLSLSNFDVEGESSESGLGGFIYGERGVWRPGDKMHLTFVMDQSITQISDEQPAVMELMSPDGLLMQRKVNNNPINGFYTFEMETPVDAKTGNWTANLRVGGKTFQKLLKVETIKPNRLKINTIFPNEILTKSSTGQGFKIKVNWLSGADAQNLKAKINANIFSSETEFQSFPKYVFADPSRSFPMQELTVFDGALNNNGEANIGTNFNLNMPAPGMLSMGLFTKVFETGGDFSSSFVTKKYSPYSTYVGLKLPVTNDYWEMLETGKEHTIQVASVDYAGNPISKKGIKVFIYRLKNSWWYNSDTNDLAYYVSRNYEFLKEEKTVNTENGKGSFKLIIPNDEYGNYFIRILDPESGHAAGKTIWIDWPDWRSRSDGNSESAAILTFKADKTIYKVGEKAQITIPSSLEGRALVSLENGSKVLSRKWIGTHKGETKFELEITPEMAPNFYVNISLLQPHSATVNDMPIRMYGIIPIMVENQDRKLIPVVKAPASIRPNSEFTVSVSEQSKKEMTYTLAVIDEGLLGITNFKTPDIYGYFNKKQALGVNTWDIFNYVLGAYGGRIESVFTIGGDQALAASNKEKINRFKPIVKFLGPFTLGKGESRSHKIKMDNYVGAVRVMVVAGNGSSFGSTEKNIMVKQPLMVLTSLPRVLNPGDEITLPVNVFAMENHVKNVSVSLKSNDLIQIDGNSTNTLQFSKTGDQLTNFKIKIPEKLGKAQLFVSAGSGKEKYTETIEIEVRSPNPPITLITSKEISGKGNWTSEYQPYGMSGTSNTKLMLSTVPAMNLEQRMNYLILYPHGCLEQTISSVFPQLYLEQLVSLSDAQKKEIRYNVEQALKKLKSFQVPGGGLAYWPGNGTADSWSSTYALHFILKAEEKAYSLPAGLKDGLIKYQIKTAKEWSGYNDKYYYNDLDQAYRLYTLALAGKPELGLMNRLKEKKTNVATLWRLSAAYKLVGQEAAAKKLVNGLSTAVKEYKFNAFTYGSSERDNAMILETLTLLGEREKGLTVLKSIANKLKSEKWYSTQTTAYSLMAICEYLGKYKIGKGINAEVTINGKSQKLTTDKSFIDIDLPESKGTFSIKENSGNILFVDLVRSGVPTLEKINEEQSNLSMSVRYYDMNNNPIDPTKLIQGTDFKCVVNITNPGMMGNYNDLALTQMFPSGWEIINTRLNDQPSVVNMGLNYQNFRDDRVYSYFDLKAAQQVSVTVLLNATYKGNFYMPATYCEAMYDKTVYALNPGKRVSVY